MKIGDVIYQDDLEKPKIDYTYFGVEGVWGLFGKRKTDSQYVCLNVGKSKDIGREVLYDIGCLHFVTPHVMGSRKYVNQFAEDCHFIWESGKTQECVYPYIFENYTELVFIMLHMTSDSNYEKKFATCTKSRFWRNGKVYENAIDDSVKEEEIIKFKNIEAITKYIAEFRCDVI